ncbi:DEAD/DEAH box helicase family protein [Atopobium fossor]|uniref:AAA family ATPase n=1 Tax=Atopobium fossor TaxID=39487 RepID=UPI0006881372|nr:AAA family ATPase [Atopobium fossor]
MGVCVMVLGASGSGKSTSLRNFKDGELAIFNVASKPLPFRGHLPKMDGATYKSIIPALQKNAYNAYVIDDATYLMAFDNFARAKDNGYSKFVDMALSFEKLLVAAAQTSKDTVVYFLMHPETDAFGKEKVRSIGKMLDEKLCIEGLFPIVINTRVDDGKHIFVTANDGTNLAKAPIDMLPDNMDNDLKQVDNAIREYWELKPLKVVK